MNIQEEFSEMAAKISKSPPDRSPSSLADLRVVELATWIFAPMAAAVLGDFGAHVIKLEPPTGEALRGLYVEEGPGSIRLDYFFELCNRNKRSVAIDLRTPQGAEVARSLIRGADVFITNLRSGALQRLGLDYEALARLNPRLIYAHGTGYGPEGPDSDRPAFDELAYWARGGFMAVLGSPDTDPVPLYGAMGDMPSGMNLLAAILLALYDRERTGAGQKVTCSLYGSGIWANAFAVQHAAATGENPPRRSRYTTINPLYNTYKTADDHWIQFAMPQTDPYWEPVAKALDLPELLTDERFRTHDLRCANVRDAVLLIERAIARRPLSEWDGIFTSYDLPWAPASTPLQITADQQALVNHYILDHTHRSGTPLKTIGLPFSLEQFPSAIRCSAAELGQHTEEVLTDLGYSWEQIEALKASSVIP